MTSVSLAAYPDLAAALATGCDVFVPPSTSPYDYAGQIVLTAPQQRIFGERGRDRWCVLRATDPTAHFLFPQAPGIALRDLTLWGSATAATYSKFAVWTDPATPAPAFSAKRVRVSGPSAGTGFANGFKFDTGSDRPRIEGIAVNRLIGTASGFGYGVLLGAANEWRVTGGEFIGGRHAIYPGAGASHGLARGNSVTGTYGAGITQYSTAAQPPCVGNVFEDNIIIDCVTGGTVGDGGIAIFGHSQGVVIRGNMVLRSGAKGVTIEGTGVTDMLDTIVENNRILNSWLMGVELCAAIGGRLLGNFIAGSSQASVGGPAHIRLVSDNTTGTSDWLIGANSTRGTRSQYSVDINASTPLPSGIKVRTDNRLCLGNSGAWLANAGSATLIYETSGTA